MVSLEAISNLLARSVRAHRESRGLSLGALAQLAGISKTSLSKIEAGQGNPSLEVLNRISQALKVPPGTLLGETHHSQLHLVRSGEGQVVKSDSGLGIRPLNLDGRNQRTEVYELVVPAGATYDSQAHGPGAEEFVFSIEGDLQIGPHGQEISLQPGDALKFPADLPHCYRSQAGAKALLIMIYPPAFGPTR
jgi:transcriptional regulator with XRE-family HTH domain